MKDDKESTNEQADESKARLRWGRILAVSLLASGGSAGVYYHLDEEHKQKMKLVQQRHVDFDLRLWKRELEANFEAKNVEAVESQLADSTMMLVSEDELADWQNQLAQLKEEIRLTQLAGLVEQAEFAIENRKFDQARELVAEAGEFAQDGELDVVIAMIEQSQLEYNFNNLLAEADRYAESGQLESAIDELDKANELIPDVDGVAVKRQLWQFQLQIMEQRREKSRELYEKATAMDEGIYSEKLLELLELAVEQDPKHLAAVELLKKASDYPQIFRVPAEVKTITLALEQARDGDEIHLAEGIYKESLWVKNGVKIVGAGMDKTVIEYSGLYGSVMTISSQQEVLLTGLSLRHNDREPDTVDQYSVLVVGGGRLSASKVKVFDSAGHGVLVCRGGEVRMSQCEMTNNLWNGVSCEDAGSQLVVDRCKVRSNQRHGVEIWNGGAGEVQLSYIEENRLAGVLAMDAPRAKIYRNTVAENGDVGVMVSAVVDCQLDLNAVNKNGLTGIVVAGAATRIKCDKNRANQNGELGIWFQPGVRVRSFSGNNAQGNALGQVRAPMSRAKKPAAADRRDDLRERPKAIPVEE